MSSVPSAPIVPGNDPTTLFTSSGMQPMIPFLLGKDHPEGKRIADSQLSFRAGDIEEVGDNRPHDILRDARELEPRRLFQEGTDSVDIHFPHGL